MKRHDVSIQQVKCIRKGGNTQEKNYISCNGFPKRKIKKSFGKECMAGNKISINNVNPGVIL